VPITATVQKENGDVVPHPMETVVYASLVGLDDAAEFPLLAHVDPYGTTVFNGLQARALLRELAVLRRRAEDEAARRALDDLTFLAHLVTGRPHRFLWLRGD
jgi:hypothetical protein